MRFSGSATTRTRFAASPTAGSACRADDSNRNGDTMASYMNLSYYQVGLAAVLILINGAISALLGLNLGRRLFLAALCTVVQLLARRPDPRMGLPTWTGGTSSSASC